MTEIEKELLEALRLALQTMFDEYPGSEHEDYPAIQKAIDVINKAESLERQKIWIVHEISGIDFPSCLNVTNTIADLRAEALMLANEVAVPLHEVSLRFTE